jgi:signal recognition particle receptor subunit alpha
MLDSFEILTTSGVVLWSKSYGPVSPSIINNLITNVFIEERILPGAGVADDVSAANNPPYKYDQHTLKWTTVKELGLIFVVSPIGSKTSQRAILTLPTIGGLPILIAPLLD